MSCFRKLGITVQLEKLAITIFDSIDGRTFRKVDGLKFDGMQLCAPKIQHNGTC